MDQLDIAIHQTAHNAPGGLAALARAIGVSEQVLRNKVCPTTDTHKLNLREALAMMDKSGDDQILAVLAELRGYTLTPKVMPNATSIMNAVLAVSAKEGDVAQVIQDSLKDFKLTENERAVITNKIRDARQSLDVLQSTILHAPANLKAVA